MNYILTFSQISKSDLAQAGGKGANLGEMTRTGFDVPPGFVVTSSAYYDFITFNKIDILIRKRLDEFDVTDTKKLQQVSKEIKTVILRAPIPPTIAEAIKQAYAQLCGDVEKFVAVRSSATAEDLPTASFAGQQSTFLNMRGEQNVIHAVKQCWASLFEPRAIFYRVEKHFDHFKVAVAVPIQEMVQSEASGVMFTVDPVTSDDSKIIIEAGFGLGEAIVSGSITPDRYIVEKNTLKILDKEINQQEWKITKVQDQDRHVSVEPSLQKKQKIDDNTIIEIAKLGIKLEQHYEDKPQDSEWAYEGGKIYLIQTRPVTTLKKPSLDKAHITKAEGKVLLRGAAASIGVASGAVIIIHSAEEIDKVKEGEVLVTEMTNPEFVPAMKKVAAIVTDTGGRTSHAAIVSRELGIPCVVGTGKATAELKTDQEVTVDGSTGIVYEGKIEISPKVEPNQPEVSFVQRSEVPVTGMKVYVNLGEVEKAGEVAKLPVDGVGLLRAEFMIANLGKHPHAFLDEGKSQEFIDKLAEGLQTFCQNFEPRPVIYRATDFKTNEYKDLKGGEKYEKDETNPMIGYRGALRYVTEPDLFKLELEAIKKVQEFGLKNIWLMIPFVRTISEFEKIKTILEEANLVQAEDFKLWIMVEVPSTVILIEKFCDLGIDGVSIGSNDLTQLILGADRDNPALASEFDERNEAVLWAMKRVIKKCREKGVTVSICGQAPSVYPEITEFFVKSGATSVSVNPDVVIKTRKLIASVEKKLASYQVEELEERINHIEKMLMRMRG